MEQETRDQTDAAKKIFKVKNSLTSKGSFRLAANLLRIATVAVCCRKSRKNLIICSDSVN